MTINEALLPEFDREMASTRKILEAVPDDKMGWAPHGKSMSLGKLTGHIAQLPDWAAGTMKTENLSLDDSYVPFMASSREELMKAFDNYTSQCREALANASDEEFMKVWKMDYKGKTVMEMPRIAVIRTMILNHMIHHRGQLSVYLRLLDIPVPGMYGPSADEKPF